MNVSVLYSDEHLIIVDKPSGLAVHRGWAKDDVTLVDVVAEILGAERVHLLGRLDRGASGVVMVARSSEMANLLSSAGGQPLVHKVYWVLVRGVAPEEGVVDHPIPNKEGGERVPALTRFRRLAWVETEIRSVSLVEATLETGRLHQIRRHMKHAGHPVLGDSNYGVPALNRAFKERYGLDRLALHCRQVSFAAMCHAPR